MVTIYGQLAVDSEDRIKIFSRPNNSILLLQNWRIRS